MNVEDQQRDTWRALKEFDFGPDNSALSDITPGLSFDFGNFKLLASAVTNRHFVDVVLFTGNLFTPRTMAQVCFELPRKVASREQLAALLVDFLGNAADKGGFQPAREVEWIAEGRRYQDLLPWRK